MDLKGKRIGFAMCGSFCTFRRVLQQLEVLASYGADITPIMSGVAYSTDTRFGSAETFRKKIEEITKKPIISTVAEAEPIGPQAL